MGLTLHWEFAMANRIRPGFLSRFLRRFVPSPGQRTAQSPGRHTNLAENSSNNGPCSPPSRKPF